MTYHYGYEDLQRLKQLITSGGKQVIGGDHLQSDSEHLKHFKSSKFEGPYYGMHLDGVLDIVNDALSRS